MSGCQSSSNGPDRQARGGPRLCDRLRAGGWWNAQTRRDPGQEYRRPHVPFEAPDALDTATPPARGAASENGRNGYRCRSTRSVPGHPATPAPLAFTNRPKGTRPDEPLKVAPGRRALARRMVGRRRSGSFTTQWRVLAARAALWRRSAYPCRSAARRTCPEARV